MAHGYLTPEAAGENNLFKTIDDLLKKLSKRGEKNGPPPETGGALTIVKKGQNADIYKEPDVQEVKVQEQISKGGSLAKRAGSSIMKGIGGSFSNMMKRGGPGAIATGGAAPSPGAGRSGNVGGGSVASPAGPLNAQSFLNKQTGDVDLAGLNDWFGRQKAAGNPDATRGNLATVMSEGAAIRSSLDPSGGNDIVAAMAANTAAIVRMEQAVKDQTDNDTEISVRETQSSEALVSKQLAASKEARMEKGGDLSQNISPDAAGQGGGSKGILGGLTNLLGGRRGGGLGGLKKGVKGLKGFGSKLLGRGAAKGAAKGVAKGASKGLLKGGLKMGIKKIPFLGLGAAALFAGQRAMAGDFAGAGMELASGGASMVPGLGTAASLGIDAALMARDATMPQMEGGGLTSGPKSGYLSMMHGTELTLSGSKSKETLKVGEMLGEGMINAQKKGKKVLSEVAGFFWQNLGYNVLFKAFKEGLTVLWKMIKKVIPGAGLLENVADLFRDRDRSRSSGGGAKVGNDLFSTISGGEGGIDSYNTGVAGSQAGYTPPKAISKMTVGQVMDEQAKGSLFAVGKYQIIPDTMKGFVSGAGINRDDIFNEETQDKFKQYVIDQKRPSVGNYLKGAEGSSLAKAQMALAAEFASVGVPRDMKKGEYADGIPARDIKKGESLYADYGGAGNAASISPEVIAKALQKEKALNDKPDPKPEPPDGGPLTLDPSEIPGENATPEEMAEYEKKLAEIAKRQAAALKAKPGGDADWAKSLPNLGDKAFIDFGSDNQFRAIKNDSGGYTIMKKGFLGAMMRLETKGKNLKLKQQLMEAAKSTDASSLTPANQDQAAAVAPASSLVASADRALTGKATTVIMPEVSSSAKTSSSGIPEHVPAAAGSSGQGLNAFVIPRSV